MRIQRRARVGALRAAESHIRTRLLSHLARLLVLPGGGDRA
jgi:hypothetical protein